MKLSLRTHAGLIILAVVCLITQRTSAETVNCTNIPSIPFTIDTQGIWCLKQDFATSITSGAAITVATNNVVIDMNGFRLGGLAAGPGTTADGIFASQRKNITIKNGTIRGFSRGIALDDISPFTASSGHVVEDIRADGNTFIGISVSGSGNMIRRNIVVNTGGSTAQTVYLGIFGVGPAVRILDNSVAMDIGVPGSTLVGIDLNVASRAIVARNEVTSIPVTPPVEFWGIAAFANSTDILIQANRVVGPGGSEGIRIDPGISAKCRDNFFGGQISSLLSGCTDSGNNN